MIKALVIDDEPLALKLMEVYIGRIEDMELVAACTSASSAMPYIDKVDVIFIDINMPDMTGLEFVRQLEDSPFVVFTTAYAEYAVEGFRVNAVDYLVKPFGFGEFNEAVGRVRKMMELAAVKDSLPKVDKVIFFQVGHQKRRFSTSEILYVESMGAYLRVYPSGEQPLVVLGNFKSIIDADPQRFIRIHKSFVVNADQIRQGGKTSVTLKEGSVLPVGEAYKRQLQDFFHS